MVNMYDYHKRYLFICVHIYIDYSPAIYDIIRKWTPHTLARLRRIRSFQYGDS